MAHRKPRAVSRKMDPARREAFIRSYNDLLNGLCDDEAVLFAGAVHPAHAARPAGCWAPKDMRLGVEQTSGRDRLNMHGAIELETGTTCLLDVETVNAVSTIKPLEEIEAAYPKQRKIRVWAGNAKYHKAVMVREWLARPECRIRLHFLPAYCPHLEPIGRLWGLMHKNVTHNRCYAKFKNFRAAIPGFPRDAVPKNWRIYRDSISDNFRVIKPSDFRVLT